MNILFINDPACVHGFKWISYFSNQTDKYKCYLIGQNHQDKRLDEQVKKKLQDNHIVYLPPVFEFSVTRTWRTLKDFQYIKRVIEQNNIDLIHIMYAEPSAMWGLGKDYFKKPMVLTTRGTDVLVTIPSITQKKHPFNRLLKSLFSRAFGNMDFITSTSTRQEQAVKDILSGAKVSTGVFRTGIYLEKVRADTSQHMVDELKGQPYLFFPRYMNTLYNHDFSLDAIQLLPASVKEKYKMVFIDGNGRAVGYIQGIRERMAAIKDVQFVFLDELQQPTLFELYKHASLVVMNPLSDGSPVSALEAMSVETPVVLGPLAYDKDLFEGTTFQISNWDAKEMALLITDILENKPTEVLQAFKTLAKKTVEEKADTLKEIKKLENVYHNILKR